MCQAGQTLPNLSGWRLTTDQQSAWTAVVRCRPRSLDVIMNVGKLTQAQTALCLTVSYLLHVLPYVGLVRTFTRHCCSVISRWLVTTVTLLVAVTRGRHVTTLCVMARGYAYATIEYVSICTYLSKNRIRVWYVLYANLT